MYSYVNIHCVYFTKYSLQCDTAYFGNMKFVSSCPKMLQCNVRNLMSFLIDIVATDLYIPSTNFVRCRLEICRKEFTSDVGMLLQQHIVKYVPRIQGVAHYVVYEFRWQLELRTPRGSFKNYMQCQEVVQTVFVSVKGQNCESRMSKNDKIFST